MKSHIQFSKNNSQISSSASKDPKKTISHKTPSAISSFSQNHIKSSILRKNTLKTKNKKGEKEGLISPRNKNRNIQQQKNNFSSKVLFAKQINNKENNFNLNENQIDNNKFYKIRREINKIIKEPYKSPYMEHLLLKGYYKDSRIENYPNYYNYYQICHLMDKKKFRLSLNYNEYLLFYDEQEYLMKYFGKNEQYIIMHYLLYKVYNRDRTVRADNPKKIMTDKQIKEMFKQLVKNNYQFDGNMEILDNIGVYFRMSFSNSGKIVLFLETLQPVIKKSINFFYVKDIPKQLIPNCMPNLFPILKKKYSYLLVFLRLRKYNRSKKNRFYEEEKALREIEYNLKYSKLIKNKQNNLNNITRNESAYKGRSSKSSNESNKVEENILKNISLSSEKEKDKDDKEIIEPTKLKNHHNENRRLLVDYDIYDLEVLLNKLSPSSGGNAEFVRREKKRITIREEKRFYSLRDLQKAKENGIKEDKKRYSLLDKIPEYQDNSLMENKKKILENNKNYFKRISKKEIFKTAIKGPIAIKSNKNKLKRIQSSQQYFSRNEIRSSTNKSLSFKTFAKFKPYFKYGKDNHDNKIISKLRKSSLLANQKKYYLKNSKSDFSSSDIQIPKVDISKNRKNYKDMTTIKYQKDMKNKIMFQRNKNIFDFNDGSATNNKYDSSEQVFNISNSNNNNNNNNNNIYLRDSSKSATNKTQKENKFKDTKEFIENALSQKNKYSVKKFCSLREFENLYDKIKAIGKLPKTKMFFHGNKYKGFSSACFDFVKSKNSNALEEQKEERSKIKDDYFLINMKNKLKKEEEKSKLLSSKYCTLKKLLKFPNIYS